MDPLLLVLVFVGGAASGFVLGAAAGALRAFRLVSARRAAAGAASSFARFGLETLPTRSAADILAGRIRVVLGGIGYEIPVLPRKASREWLETLDARFAAVADELERAKDDTPRILTMLAAQSASLLDLLRSYDVNGVLPEPAYLDEFATDAEILRATVEVWRAANPLAATLVEAAADATDGTPSEPPKPLLPSTGGDLASSTS